MARSVAKRKSDGSGQLDGSVGVGAKRIPTAAPAAPGGGPDSGDVAGGRPQFFSNPLPTAEIENVFRQSGVQNYRQAAETLVLAYMDPDGSFPVPPKAWGPLNPGCVRALLYGNRYLYGAERFEDFHHSMIDMSDSAADLMEAKFPNAGDPSRSILRENARMKPSYDSRPVATRGLFAIQGHPFTRTLDADSLRYQDPGPVTVQDVISLLDREERTIDTVKDLSTATFLRGQVSLREGNWKLDAGRISSEALNMGLDEESTYQVLALVYSQGRSTNSGFDAPWAPACDKSEVTDEVRNWLVRTGRDGEWFEFGQWATSEA